MHWNVEASALYFGAVFSSACTLPAQNRSAARHETLPVSAKIFMRLFFIDFLPRRFGFDILTRLWRAICGLNLGRRVSQLLMITSTTSRRGTRLPLARRLLLSKDVAELFRPLVG
jgi:hypothetical protein